VVAIGPDAALAAGGAVDGAGAADGQALEAADERLAGVALDDQVHVVHLDAEVNHPEFVAAGGSEGLAHGGVDGPRAKVRDSGAGAEGHVTGMPGIVGGASVVGHAGAAGSGFATGAAAFSAPGARGGELELSRGAGARHESGTARTSSARGARGCATAALFRGKRRAFAGDLESAENCGRPMV